MPTNSRSLVVAQGKGLDLDAARASGLMEAIETYHAERIDLPLKLASFQALQEHHPVVDAAALPRLAQGRFTPTRRVLWIEGRDLIAGTPVWLPYDPALPYFFQRVQLPRLRASHQRIQRGRDRYSCRFP